ncbi:MAG: glycosyltransferase family 4 protein [Candidatus Bathyarchaeia archaeon]
MDVCFIATEFFGWGRYGGFGKCTRDIASGLAERGFKVSVVVPRARGQRPLEDVNGVLVYSHHFVAYPFTGQMYRRCNADIYHSEDPSWGSLIALRSMREKTHLVTCQNPRSVEDWHEVNRYYLTRRRLFNRLFWGEIGRAMRGMDGVYCQSWHVIPKAKSVYGLEETPRFLPNPVEVPDRIPEKLETPTVCFLGRLDGEKRPEIFFDLARKFPDINFIAVGKAHDQARDDRLRRMYSGIPNLELTGFKRGREKIGILEDSWILVNTSVSECLPISFLEAAAQGCAILSLHDPDDFATKFGYRASSVEDLSSGLSMLVEDGSWRERGKRGYEYVKNVHERPRVIDMHINIYERSLKKEL